MRPCPIPAEAIVNALDRANGNFTSAARYLKKDYPNEEITSQLVRYWLSRMDPSETGEDYDRAKQLLRTRNIATENNKLRRDQRALADSLGSKADFLGALERLVEDLPTRPPIEHKKFFGGQAGIPMTVEVLLSDLQIGKLSPGYNTEVARKRLYEFGRAVCAQIEAKATLGYRIERIILAIIGDIIESDKKHSNSARATDTGTAEQMYDAMEGLLTLVIEPLARLGVELHIIGVTGNHDHDDHGIVMFQPGKQQLSWPLYKGLELMTRKAGYLHVTWDIPEGSYTTADIYGQKALYEHGVGVSVTEAAMKAHKIKRAEQEKQHLTYFRMGDKHTVTSFNSGQMVVNGAFFGATLGGTEYSGIAGFSSVAAQWMGFHVPREDKRMTLYDSFTIQLDHVG